MKIEKNNFKVEVNKPEINFDALKLEEAEKKEFNKNKKKIIILSVLTVGAATISKIYKATKKHSKK